MVQSTQIQLIDREACMLFTDVERNHDCKEIFRQNYFSVNYFKTLELSKQLNNYYMLPHVS